MPRMVLCPHSNIPNQFHHQHILRQRHQTGIQKPGETDRWRNTFGEDNSCTGGGIADEYSSPANIKMEVVNPAAPDTIQYSDEYRERFLGVYDGAGPGMDDSQSHSVESGIY